MLKYFTFLAICALASSVCIAKNKASASHASDFIAPSQLLAQYHGLLIGDISFNYLNQPSNDKWKMEREQNYPLSEQRLEQLKKDISEIATKALTKSGALSSVSKAEKGVLKINIALKEVRITTATLAQKSRPNTDSYTQTPMHVTLEAELRDSLSNELLAKFTQKRTNSNRFNYFYRSSKSRDDFETRKLIRHWANKIRKKFDQAITSVPQGIVQ